MIHIGVNIRLFPTTGMTLPFISYGGSSIISISILSGIIFKFNKKEKLFKMKKNLLITTGGSGGHVVPAIILFEHLSKEINLIITDKED